MRAFSALALSLLLLVLALAPACGGGVVERCEDLEPCQGAVGSCSPGYSCASIGRCAGQRLCAREATNDAYHCAVQCERPVGDVFDGECICSVGQSTPPFIGDCRCS